MIVILIFLIIESIREFVFKIYVVKIVCVCNCLCESEEYELEMRLGLFVKSFGRRV